MVEKIKYYDFTSPKSNSITIVNDKNQEWELIRYGISQEEIKKIVKENGKTEGIKILIGNGSLVPVYGGDLNI